MTKSNYREDFPEFGELNVALPEGFEDKSEGNDAMPKFERQLSDGSTIRIWVDYADRTMGDRPGAPRFCVEHFLDDEALDSPVPLRKPLVASEWTDVMACVSDVVSLSR